MSRIFISYSLIDKAYVNKLHRHLLDQGFDAWIDDRIDYGTQWPREIEKRLKECEVFILVMSPNSYESEWVQNELSFAKQLNKPVFPLLLDGNVWWHLQTTQFADVKGGKLPPTKFFIRLAEIASRHKTDADSDKAQNLQGTSTSGLGVGGNVSGSVIIAGNGNVVHLGDSEKANRELAEKASREKAEREAVEDASHEKEEREAAEKAAIGKVKREADEKAAHEKAEREAAEKTAREKKERETAEKRAREKAEHEATEKLAQEKSQKELEREAKKRIANAERERRAIMRRHKWRNFLSNIRYRFAIIRIYALPILLFLVSIGLLGYGIYYLVNTFSAPIQPLNATPTLTLVNDAKGLSMSLVSSETQIASFYLDIYEITNEEYKKCDVCDAPLNQSAYNDANYANYPVVYVTWDMAQNYCEWRGARLPTKEEWKLAAYGYTDNRIFPWGDQFGCDKANYGSCVGKVSPVDSYESGVSPFGIYNIMGNVWEWIDEEYRSFQGYHLVLGGSFNSSISEIKTEKGVSNSDIYSGTFNDIGFRCAKDTNP